MTLSSRRTLPGVVVLLMIEALLRPLPAQRGVGVASPPSGQVVGGRIAAGTRMDARLEEAIDAAHSRIGDQFRARVTEPVRSESGTVEVPAGAIVLGTITRIQRAHDRLAPAFVRLTVRSISFGDQVHPIRATVESTRFAGAGAQHGGASARPAFPGIALGAVLIGIGADDGRQGSIISLGTGDAGLRLPSGTVLRLRVN
jgi:hypothetical protein